MAQKLSKIHKAAQTFDDAEKELDQERQARTAFTALLGVLDKTGAVRDAVALYDRASHFQQVDQKSNTTLVLEVGRREAGASDRVLTLSFLYKGTPLLTASKIWQNTSRETMPVCFLEGKMGDLILLSSSAVQAGSLEDFPKFVKVFENLHKTEIDTKKSQQRSMFQGVLRFLNECSQGQIEAAFENRAPDFSFQAIDPQSENLLRLDLAPSDATPSSAGKCRIIISLIEQNDSSAEANGTPILVACVERANWREPPSEKNGVVLYAGDHEDLKSLSARLQSLSGQQGGPEIKILAPA